MNRATRRAAAKGREARMISKTPASLLFCRELDEMLIAEQSAAMAFREGYAQAYHFDMLLEGLMMIGFAANDEARQSPDTSACNMVEFASIALLNIRDRHDRTKKLGATGEELKALALLVETSSDFWPRQSRTVYARAYAKTGEWKQSAVTAAREAMAAA